MPSFVAFGMDGAAASGITPRVPAPVSAGTALGHGIALPLRVQTLVRAENPFNDATSPVLRGGGTVIGAAVAAVSSRRPIEPGHVKTVSRSPGPAPRNR